MSTGSYVDDKTKRDGGVWLSSTGSTYGEPDPFQKTNNKKNKNSMTSLERTRRIHRKPLRSAGRAASPSTYEPVDIRREGRNGRIK